MCVQKISRKLSLFVEIVVSNLACGQPGNAAGLTCSWKTSRKGAPVKLTITDGSTLSKDFTDVTAGRMTFAGEELTSGQTYTIKVELKAGVFTTFTQVSLYSDYVRSGHQFDGPFFLCSRGSESNAPQVYTAGLFCISH